MRQPDIYNASVIKYWPNNTQLPNGAWVPARPVGHTAFTWKWRFRMAWAVFCGKCDVLQWECDLVTDPPERKETEK